MTYKPPNCSERELGGYEDCTWCSGVDLGNAMKGSAVYPTTRAEYEGLRVDGGDGPAENPGDGSNLRQLAVGMTRRYGFTGTLLAPGLSWPLVRDALRPGWAGAIQGSMGAFASGHPLRRWDPSFAGGHCVHVVVDDGPQYWWQNPLAPNSYQGEYVSEAQLRAYYEALPGAQALVAAVGSQGEAKMPLFQPKESYSGEIEIAQDEVAVLIAHTNQPFGLPKGERRRAFAKGYLPNQDSLPGNGLPSLHFEGDAYVIGDDEAYALARNVVPWPDQAPEPPQPSVPADEAAIRSDQQALDRDAIGRHFIP